MLDLGIYPLQLFDAVKMPDGTVITVKEPSVALKNLVSNTMLNIKTMNDAQLEKAFTELIFKILNNNIEKIKITYEAVESLSVKAIETLINEYVKFINEIQKNPN